VKGGSPFTSFSKTKNPDVEVRVLYSRRLRSLGVDSARYFQYYSKMKFSGNEKSQTTEVIWDLTFS
jgi:hypothetical protein